VDFVALAEAACKASEGVEVWGPVEQGRWLESMGGKVRAEQLVKGAGEEKKRRVMGAWERLVDRSVSGMGKVYKVMAIVPEGGGKRSPVAFGGDVKSEG